ncbi:antitoxin Xre/MbcA/ParS toxin-binding domain-containing protein [Variovorax sp. J31P207]|uniref:antitoxin Xre/MbcA/ParS toxin-binding domain-containing protein n=1 Tax=Variovorax sp. J31P207 TaxID=3053510 RepID=UPI00257598EE|nr:antitoxin Xre/MbcA/ParS toxin-binding domain-containing protein [Variovorax sp. J31P207]MDM0066748.1 DUF2384 domain-containing protein [Variovorax sp. J31P207]
MSILNPASWTGAADEYPYVLQAIPCGHPARVSADGVAKRDAAFVALLNAYRATGGLVRGNDLAHLMASRASGDPASLSRSMAAGEILCFDWNETFWIPAFQLDRESLGTGQATRLLLAELSGAFDGWAAAQWLVAANAWLGERTPLELLGTHLEAVLDAARADSFIARG